MSLSNPPLHPTDWQTTTHLQNGEWEEALRGLEQMLVQRPHNLHLRRMLEETRYKAKLDGATRIRSRRWIFPYQKSIDRLILGLGIFMLLWLGAALLYWQNTRSVAKAESQRLHSVWLAEADAFLRTDHLIDAQQRLERILADLPNDELALAKLAKVKQERALLYNYQQAVARQIGGDCPAALPIYQDLQRQRPTYRDVATRITTCTQAQQLAQLLDQAANFERSGQIMPAIEQYEASRQLGGNQLSDGTPLTARLATLYLQAGLDELKKSTISVEQLQQAQTFFNNALQFDAQNAEASSQEILINRYLTGQSAVEQKDWATAVSNLRTVYEERADYLNGAAVALLYNAYIGLGDGYRTAGDCSLALQRYSAAAALPVADAWLAKSRSNLAGCGDGTTTDAEIQPIAESVPITNSPTEVPTPPPATLPPTTLQLATLQNRIVFKSSNQAQPGFWVMNGDGSNRQFVGGFEDAQWLAQINTLLASYRISPDNEFQVFVGDVDEKSQILIGRLDGTWPARPLTKLTGIAYDPQWSPVNGAVVFVSQEDGSDDIWFIDADGQSQHSLVRNTWEWDKSPSWSPDGSQIAFWSNRTGLKQIFVISADGKIVKNVSNSAWDEFDPLWVR